MKLSPTMQDVIDRMKAAGEPLVRKPGGYWTLPSVPEQPGSEFHAPAWHVGVQTVRSLEKRGCLVRMGVYAEEWRDSRRLAPACGGSPELFPPR